MNSRLNRLSIWEAGITEHKFLFFFTITMNKNRFASVVFLLCAVCWVLSGILMLSSGSVSLFAVDIALAAVFISLSVLFQRKAQKEIL